MPLIVLEISVRSSLSLLCSSENKPSPIECFFYKTTSLLTSWRIFSAPSLLPLHPSCSVATRNVYHPASVLQPIFCTAANDIPTLVLSAIVNDSMFTILFLHYSIKLCHHFQDLCTCTPMSLRTSMLLTFTLHVLPEFDFPKYMNLYLSINSYLPLLCLASELIYVLL